MRFLVTGASGLLGKALCDQLLIRDHDVVGTSREPRRVRSTNPKLDWHPWDPTAGPVPAEALEGVDAVVHLAGEEINQRWTKAAKRRIMDSRRLGTRNLVSAMEANDRRPDVLVSASAIGYYGDRGEAELDESSGPGDDFAAQVCVAWEREATRAEELGLRVAILRNGLVQTPDGGLLKQLLLPFRLGLGGPIASGRQWMSWIHIDDEVELLIEAATNPKAKGPINATAPEPVRNREYSKSLGRVLHRPAIAPVPKLAVAALRGRELAEIAAAGQKVMPRRAQGLGYEFRFPQLEPALKDLLG